MELAGQILIAMPGMADPRFERVPSRSPWLVYRLTNSALLLGVVGLLTHHNAIWGALWADVVLLGLIGFLGVSRWTDRLEIQALAGLATALLGIVLIALKAFVH